MMEPATLGRSLASLDLGWLSLRETLHLPGFRLARHSHEHATVNFLLAGGFNETIGGRSWEVRSSLVVAKPSGEPHANAYGSDGARCLLIELSEAKAPPAGDFAPGLFELERPVVFESELATAASLGLARELRLSDSATPLVAEGILLELFASLEVASRPRPLSPSRPAWLERAVALIEERLFEPLRIAEIAREAGVHPVHLAREFRRHLHLSPGELVRLHRLAWARDRLRRSDLPVSSIAATAGFSDQSHLTRRFRARYGISPALYRRRAAPRATLQTF